MTDNFKKVISILLFAVGMCIFFGCLIWDTYLYWTNIDMTTQRLFIEHPLPPVLSVVGAIMICIGKEIK